MSSSPAWSGAHKIETQIESSSNSAQLARPAFTLPYLLCTGIMQVSQSIVSLVLAPRINGCPYQSVQICWEWRIFRTEDSIFLITEFEFEFWIWDSLKNSSRNSPQIWSSSPLVKLSFFFNERVRKIEESIGIREKKYNELLVIHSHIQIFRK